MSAIYLVMCAHGEHDDRDRHPVRAFREEEMALACVAEITQEWARLCVEVQAVLDEHDLDHSLFGDTYIIAQWGGGGSLELLREHNPKNEAVKVLPSTMRSLDRHTARGNEIPSAADVRRWYVEEIELRDMGDA